MFVSLDLDGSALPHLLSTWINLTALCLANFKVGIVKVSIFHMQVRSNKNVQKMKTNQAAVGKGQFWRQAVFKMNF